MAKIQKVCVITGASSGLGYETSKKMAALGYEVVLACQDKSKAKLAISRIKRGLPDAKLMYMNLDLASFSSIAKFSNTFRDSGKKLNVLINNAGWMDTGSSRAPSCTEDGVEKTFAVNYLGHFLLTTLLLDVLKSTAKFDLEARIVVISSTVAKQLRKNGLDIDDIQLLKPGSYTGRVAYRNSQIARVLFALELHRQLEGTGVTCNVVTPGKFLRSTGLFRNQSFLRKYIFPCFCSCLGTSVDRAASAVVFVATDGNLNRISGHFFIGYEECENPVETGEMDLAKQLWDFSKTMIADVL